MTEHTITVEETVEKEQAVHTCDYCGKGDDAGEMLHYAFDSSNREGIFGALDDLVDESETAPDLHYHVSCLTKVVASERQAKEITLKSEYDRRSGDALLLVVTKASLVFYGVGFFSLALGVVGEGFLSFMWFSLALVWLGSALYLSHREAKTAISEFTT